MKTICVVNLFRSRLLKLTEELKSTKSEFETEKAVLLSRISDLEVELAAKSVSSAEESEKLKDTCTKLVKKLKETVTEKDKMTASFNESDAAKQNLSSQVEQLHATVDSLSSEILLLKTTITNTEAELIDIKASHEILSNANNDYLSKISELEAQVSASFSAIASANSTKDQEQITTLSNELAAKTELLEAQSKNLEEQEEVCSGLEAELNVSNDEKQKALNELEDLRKELFTSSEELSKARSQVQGFESKFEKEAEEREKMKGMLTKAMDKLKVVTATSKDEKNVLEKEVAELKSQLLAVKQKSDDVLTLEDLANTRERKIKDLEAIVRKNEELSAELLMKSDDQSRIIKSKEKRIEDCEKSIENLNLEMQKTQDDLNSIGKECAILESLAKRMERLLFPTSESKMPGQGEPSTNALHLLSLVADEIFVEVL